MARKKKAATAPKKVNLDIENLRAKLQKEFGESSIKTYTDAVKTPMIPTGIIPIDLALGGGVPQGRMIELLGEASSGKTTIALSILAQAQKKFPDKQAVYIDAEHALDTVWAKKLGVNFERFDHVDPEYAEDAVFIMESYLKTGQVSVIVLDSAAALLPKAEEEGDIGDANIGLQARIIASTMRRVNRLINKNRDTLVIWINQKRARIGGGPTSFAFEATKSTGGKALPFYMTTRMSVVKIKSIKNSNSQEIGQEVKVDVAKNKIGTGPGARLTFQIDNRTGVDNAKAMLDWAKEVGKVEQGGAWYTFPDGTKCQGEDAAKEHIRSNLYDEWYKELVGG